MGSSGKPVGVMQRAVEGIQGIMDSAEQRMREAKPEGLASTVQAGRMAEVEGLRKVR